MKTNLRLLPAKEVRKNTQLSAMIHELKWEEELKKGRVKLPSFNRWDRLSHHNLYVIFDEDEGKPVGLIDWTGPLTAAEPAWWIHSTSRRKGYGTRAVEMLAEVMHRTGVKHIKDISIDTKTEGEYRASSKLAQHLRRHFKKQMAQS